MRDATDKQTIDFVGAELAVSCGQVLMDRCKHFAIVARKSPKYAHLVHAQTGTLKLSKISAEQLVADWIDADCPLESAVTKLLNMGKRCGITASARTALESLQASKRPPVQYALFA